MGIWEEWQLAEAGVEYGIFIIWDIVSGCQKQVCSVLVSMRERMVRKLDMLFSF